MAFRKYQMLPYHVNGWIAPEQLPDARSQWPQGTDPHLLTPGYWAGMDAEVQQGLSRRVLAEQEERAWKGNTQHLAKLRRQQAEAVLDQAIGKPAPRQPIPISRPRRKNPLLSHRHIWLRFKEFRLLFVYWRDPIIEKRLNVFVKRSDSHFLQDSHQERDG